MSGETVKPPASEPEAMMVSVVPRFAPDTPSTYCNYAFVRHTANEFTISAMDVRNVRPENVHDGHVDITPDFELIVPPRVMVGLKKAIEVQINKYEEEFGGIAD